MTVTRLVGTLALLAGSIGIAGSVPAQTTHGVQPIVLTASPVCCQNPASIASEPVPLPRRDGTYLRPEERDPMRVVYRASQLIPLPTPQQWRGYETAVQQVGGYQANPVTSSPITLPPTGSVQVFRPISAAPPTPAVPPGYVVGKGLFGDLKLYKPGQPIRNFLRYITY